MPVNKSVQAYKKERLNCAQSILRGFQDNINISDESIAEARAHGGGRAEQGLCGALHSALNLAEDIKTKEKISQDFTHKAGSDKCREIRKKAQIPCVECVELAAELLAKHKSLPQQSKTQV